jgi:hypothetical protein
VNFSTNKKKFPPSWQMAKRYTNLLRTLQITCGSICRISCLILAFKSSIIFFFLIDPKKYNVDLYYYLKFLSCLSFRMYFMPKDCHLEIQIDVSEDFCQK